MRLGDWFQFYDDLRPHVPPGYLSPAGLFHGAREADEEECNERGCTGDGLEPSAGAESSLSVTSTGSRQRPAKKIKSMMSYVVDLKSGDQIDSRLTEVVTRRLARQVVRKW